MPVITIETFIKAPSERVFDLSTSIELHMQSTKTTNEIAIAGRTTGLIKLGETVTWRAKHLGIYQQLTVEITAYERPLFFEDKMLKGIFKSMHHKHQFAPHEEGTIMTDVFTYKSPLGLLGRMTDSLFLKNYMHRFLLIRNSEIKKLAEGDGWKAVRGML